MSREERIRPAPKISLASSDAGPLVLLAQDGAQVSAHEAVEGAVQGWRGMLEVTKPSPDIPSSAMRAALWSLCQSPQRQRLLPGFATNEQARHSFTPKQVRHPPLSR
jgi:hypothetical protein